MGSGKPTSLDIAYRAGVSQSTVSRALRDSPLVNEETRARIKQIARELNYRVDRSAAGLRSQKSHTIALLLFEDPTIDDSQINPFFLALLSSITRAAARHQYDVLISFQSLSDDWHSEYQASNRADGIILLGYGDFLAYRDKLEKLREHGTHFVLWGPTMLDDAGHSVASDNARGGREATQHLLRLGRRRIAFIGEASDRAPEFAERHQGYCEALRQAGLAVDPALHADAESSETSGFHAVGRLLDRGADFDAIVAASDLIAIGAIKALRKRGLRVPDHVAVVGFDDIFAAEYFNPSLTTVRQDTRAAGEALVTNLMAMMRGEPVASEPLRPRLVVRTSCGSALAD